MTQEDKELLLKDLCARLPYGVKVSIDDRHWCDFCKDIPYEITLENSYRILLGVTLGYVKPYLFPLSNMTEEQKREYNSLRNFVPTYHYEFGDIVEDTELFDNYESIDYLIANHFDYRGLIPMGLSIDATGKNIY